MSNIQGFINMSVYFEYNSPKKVLQEVYGREFQENDYYYIEKLDVYNKDKLRWISMLDKVCLNRLNELSTGLKYDK